jgi:hypothetical protein
VLCRPPISPLLEIYINDFTILVNASPQVVPLTLDFHEYFINK